MTLCFRILPVSLLLLVSFSVRPQTVTDAGKLQADLLGKWQGRAVHTPLGPTPYDIDFQRRDESCLSGTAYNGFTHHTWTFCEAAGQLLLDFLSDFRGNDRPIHFQLIDAEDSVLTFHAASHDFMDVLLSIGEERGWINILHHGKLHVRIELER